MKILAFDTTNNIGSVALLNGDKVLSYRVIERGDRLAELLVPTIEEVLGEAGIEYADLDAMAITVGPGSFTGVRIGLATAKGLKLASGLPLIGVTCLESIAYPYQSGEYNNYQYEKIWVIMNAGREGFYSQLFDLDLKPLSEPTLVKASEVSALVPTGKFLVVGSGKDKVKESLVGDVYIGDGDDNIDARNVARIAQDKIKSGSDDGSGNVEPLYLRPPQIMERKK